jgi:hypothetical protein
LADFPRLARWLETAIGDRQWTPLVSRANTAREILEMLPRQHLAAVMAQVGARMLRALRRLSGPQPQLTAVILTFSGEPLFWQTDPGGRP